ncbi:P-loop containing nucleoside triphosphate hydrolase [Pseudocohnilembus persalinus]|uniref:p-loop containing nucleoside triphosphate hydrolase n=1 Tax=Pseudocohnilembus persalinus TaxID=266149 RepID=A0A0V0R3P0_PSEPJ|nr:P-loop containing nucleoside triphosphate hydrolase [Pseudocohnilembus persalinus]|eukprot:KRX09105.1 P-loop containing nucleoside triphosphate hydrolase [Pseudocohnilembus persalinus]
MNQNLKANEIIKKIQSEQDPKKSYEYILLMLQQILLYGNACKFKQNTSSDKTTLLVIGDVGNGKSILSNLLLHYYSLLIKKIPYDKKKNGYFLSKQQIESVTKAMKQIYYHQLQIIDSPGSNDPNKQLTDAKISEMTCEHLSKIIYEEGLTGIIQCVMLNRSTEIQKCFLKNMSQILLSLTLSYPESDNTKCPRINVVFTGVTFTKHLDERSNDNEFGFCSDDWPAEKIVDNYVDKSQLIQSYKQLVLECIVEDCGLEFGFQNDQFKIQKLQQKIDILLQPSNFYAYDLYILKKQKPNCPEQKEIERLIKDNMSHKLWQVINQNDASVSPVYQSTQNRKAIDHLIQQLIQNCQQQLQFGQETFKKACNGQKESQFINDSIAQVNDIKQKYNCMINNCPQALLKTHIFLVTLFKEQLSQLSMMIQSIVNEQIGQYNSEMMQNHPNQVKEMDAKLKKSQAESEKSLKKLKEENQQQKQEFDNKVAKVYKEIKQQEEALKKEQKQSSNNMKNK